jgi:hypothetical protein
MSDDLQFDRVAVAGPAAEAAGAPGVVCGGCHARLETDYYEINGRPFCADCRGRIEAIAETPRGLTPFAVAAIFGLGAAVAGAAIYYAVIALLNLEIGLVAILIGYMVGYAVRKGAGGRGGLRFQILAAVLTYCAVGLAYTPFALQGASTVPWIMALVLIPVLPVLIVVKTMPTGLITALIIFFGIRQAMRMTATPVLQISGPFRIGSAGSSAH